MKTMKISQVNDEYIMQDSPVVLRVLGVFFMGLGIIAVGYVLNEFRDSYTSHILNLFVGLTVSGSSFLIGLCMLLTSASQVKISTRRKCLILNRNNLFKKTIKVISFQEIQRFIVNENSNIDNDQFWKVDVLLKSGEILELTKVWCGCKDQCDETVMKVNKLLHHASSVV